MRISTIFSFLLLVSFAVPVFVFAQTTPQINGSRCGGNPECVSGFCDQSDPINGGVCMSNPGQGSNPGGSVALINPLNSGTSLESFLGSIMDFVIRIGSIVVILMIVYVGYLFVIARGNESKITEARKALLWTVIGALVLLGAKAISSGILATVQSLGG